MLRREENGVVVAPKFGRVAGAIATLAAVGAIAIAPGTAIGQVSKGDIAAGASSKHPIIRSRLGLRPSFP